MKKQTRKQHLQNKIVFCSLKSVRGLAGALNYNQQRLYLLAAQPRYKTFTIPKKDGGERTIEAPGSELKKVLSRLNRYLQSTYLFEQSSAAHGFVTSVANDDDRKSILSNAKKHVGRPYMLNVDLKSFFHSISREKVLNIFLGQPFKFKGELADLLADLVTYQKRLPMGTPTSPVLSNFACRSLDKKLLAMSKDLLWVYTRYADDLTFSSKQSFVVEKINSVFRIIRDEGFEVNTQKVKRFGPDDTKIVTGLIVSDQVTIDPSFVELLRKDIQQLGLVVKTQHEQGVLSTFWVEKQKRQISGRINFAGYVMKRTHPDYLELKDAYYVAITPPQDEFGAMSWRGFPYNM